ncbi:hypothetical protein EZ449_01870 [Pedobacter frigidisoli]|uniref:Uncharacterized protein n=1 Tax=Pedobacter frigidisoli TaxID=2530455 RepID=A0A4R0PAE0_9SPHI|nr:hypothetical protein [Pedobacter frigidisoli]TCD12818.1 hypothetical protein EZ449_01870 [Pedobacter frigidisoli]
MKTSNKLLIALAATLIIIPILVIAVNVKLNYRKSDSRDSYFGSIMINNEAFEHKSLGRLAVPIAQPFTSIKFDDAMGSSVQIYVKKDKRYGVKIQESFKDQLTTTVNKNGELIISLNKEINFTGGDKIIIVVYCPTIKSIEVKNAFITELAAVADTLNVNIENSESLFFTGPFSSKDDASSITKTTNHTEINMLKLSLKNTEFNSYYPVVKNLNITASKSRVNVGSDDKAKISVYNNLSIIARDTSTVKIENIKANTLRGDFSDDTQLQIPTSILRQLLKGS